MQLDAKDLIIISLAVLLAVQTWLSSRSFSATVESFIGAQRQFADHLYNSSPIYKGAVDVLRPVTDVADSLLGDDTDIGKAVHAANEFLKTVDGVDESTTTTTLSAK